MLNQLKNSMKTYTGTKTIQAEPMNRGDYNKFKGWDLPLGEDPADEGYKVHYEDGHISWSPKATFEKAYRVGTKTKRGYNTVEIGSHYQIPTYKVVEGLGIEPTGEMLDIKFVRGSKLGSDGVEPREGTLHEHLLSVMINDLKFKMSIMPSKETACQITHLEEALHWAEERESARAAQGVLGTYKPHTS